MGSKRLVDLLKMRSSSIAKCDDIPVLRCRCCLLRSLLAVALAVALRIVRGCRLCVVLKTLPAGLLLCECEDSPCGSSLCVFCEDSPCGSSSSSLCSRVSV